MDTRVALRELAHRTPTRELTSAYASAEHARAVQAVTQVGLDAEYKPSILVIDNAQRKTT